MTPPGNETENGYHSQKYSFGTYFQVQNIVIIKMQSILSDWFKDYIHNNNYRTGQLLHISGMTHSLGYNPNTVA